MPASLSQISLMTVIMLDEPSLGPAPLLVEEIVTIVAQINREQGIAIR